MSNTRSITATANCDLLAIAYANAPFDQTSHIAGLTVQSFTTTDQQVHTVGATRIIASTEGDAMDQFVHVDTDYGTTYELGFYNSQIGSFNALLPELFSLQVTLTLGNHNYRTVSA